MSFLETFYLGETTETNYTYVYKDKEESSKFYIHKWRVPEPPPKLIIVKVMFPAEFQEEKNYVESAFYKNLQLRMEPILCTVNRTSFHTGTTRFDTVGVYRPFNTIYVPNSMLNGHEGVGKIQVLITWN